MRGCERSEKKMEVFICAPCFRLTWGQLTFRTGSAVEDVLDQVTRQTGVSSLDFFITCNGHLSHLEDPLQDGAVYHLEPRLRGGKGGFGSMLRALGAQIEKTTNREACRDLSGRRLRDVNHEKEMAEWLKKQSDREAEKEQRRLERLQRKLSEPKHQFTDTEYQQQCHNLSERLEDSVLKGLQAMSSTQVDNGSGSKRPNPDQNTPLATKKKKTAASLWVGMDEILSSEEEEEAVSTSRDRAVAMAMQMEVASTVSSPSSSRDQSLELRSRPAETSSSPLQGPPVDSQESVGERSSPVDSQESVGERSSPVDSQESVGERSSPVDSQESVGERSSPVDSQESVGERSSPVDSQESVGERSSPVDSQESVGERSSPVDSQESVGERSSPVDSQESVGERSSPVDSQESVGELNPPVEPQTAAGERRSPVDLQGVQSVDELEALGLDVLKEELMLRGMKCGGTLAERAARLFAIRLTEDQIDPALLAKPSKAKRKCKGQRS